MTTRTFSFTVTAVPSSGSLTDGAVFTIAGSGFGTKPQAPPLHFDRFESGTAGATLTGASAPTVGSGYVNITASPKYDNSQAFSGTKSLLMDYSLDTTTSAIHASVGGLNNSQEAYYSYRVRKQYLGPQNTSSGTWQIKYARVGPNTTNFDTPLNAPVFDQYVELNGTADSGPTNTGIGQYGSVDSGGTGWQAGPVLSANTWHRLEGYSRLPSPFNTSTGERYFKKNFVNTGNVSAWPGPWSNPNNVSGYPTTDYNGAPWNTYTGSTANTGYSMFITPFYNRASYSIKLWVDELWIDTTQARVEIGNAATWNACTKRSPQPATAWASNGTSITVTLNKGDQTTGQTAYAFVVKTDGTILELGPVGEWA
jgi:hypothetical protein